MFGFWMHQLDLTTDQRAQVKQIMEKEKPTLRPLMRADGAGLTCNSRSLNSMATCARRPDPSLMAAQQAQQWLASW